MGAKPVQISIDTDLLSKIDADPEVQEQGRSSFVRSAVLLYLKTKERQDIEDRIAKAYEGKAEELAKEVEELFEVQAWPSD